jgi:hypothetical protein
MQRIVRHAGIDALFAPVKSLRSIAEARRP